LSLPPDSTPFPEHRDRLYQAIGRSLARWQYIETGLFLIAFTILNTTAKNCSLTFFGIKSAENKLALADRLTFHHMNQRAHNVYWRPISKSISDYIPFRNSMAHFEVSFLKEEGIGKVTPHTKFRHILTPHHLDEHAARGGTIKSFSVEAIDKNADTIREISYSLVYFLIDHFPNLERQQASIPPHLAQWLDQFRKDPRPPGFEPPPKSSYPNPLSNKQQ
jgi:hypothetical protein